MLLRVCVRVASALDENPPLPPHSPFLHFPLTFSSNSMKIMYEHVNQRNGKWSPLLADDVYEIIKEVCTVQVAGQSALVCLKKKIVYIYIVE